MHLIFQAESQQRHAGRRVRVDLPTGPSAPARARTALHELREAVSPACLEVVELVLSELVTNAVRHSGGEPGSPVGIDVECGRTAVRIAVTDRGPGFDPERRGAPRGENGGWGLYVVGEVADRWWVERANPGARVVAEVPRN